MIEPKAFSLKQTAWDEGKNLSLNSDLLAKTRALNINLSAALEQALKKELEKAKAKQLSDENKAAIKAYNKFIEENGRFGDEFRRF